MDIIYSPAMAAELLTMIREGEKARQAAELLGIDISGALLTPGPSNMANGHHRSAPASANGAKGAAVRTANGNTATKQVGSHADKGAITQAQRQFGMDTGKLKSKRGRIPTEVAAAWMNSIATEPALLNSYLERFGAATRYPVQDAPETTVTAPDTSTPDVPQTDAKPPVTPVPGTEAPQGQASTTPAPPVVTPFKPPAAPKAPSTSKPKATGSRRAATGSPTTAARRNRKPVSVG